MFSMNNVRLAFILQMNEKKKTEKSLCFLNVFKFFGAMDGVCVGECVRRTWWPLFSQMMEDKYFTTSWRGRSSSSN